MVDGEEQVQDLLDRFLGSRGDRTARAYRVDIEDFGRFVSARPSGAITRLLAGGSGQARHAVLEFAADLRERGRAQSTVDRRLATLHAFVTAAHEAGLVSWALETPTEGEIDAAVEGRSVQGSYLLPRHHSEVDRLDLQHHALRERLGAHYLAPVERVTRALDVGAGTGQWAYELCASFPAARVVGYDLVASKPGGPPGYRCVRGNVLHGLPFQADQFDFVHQRLLITGIPVAAWPGVVEDLVRVTRPGGWVELGEITMGPAPSGPANERMTGLLHEMAVGLGLDSGCVVFDRLDGYLRDAGLVDVTRREVAMPVGHWEGRIGGLFATDVRAAYTRLCEVLQARGRITQQATRDLIEQVQDEWEEQRVYWPVALVHGRKPA